MNAPYFNFPDLLDAAFFWICLQSLDASLTEVDRRYGDFGE
jgi:hypothetical protein